MTTFDIRQPTWAYVRDALVIGILVLVLFRNSSNFDKTERASLMEFATAFVSLSAAHRLAKSAKRRKEHDEDPDDNTPANDQPTLRENACEP